MQYGWLVRDAPQIEPGLQGQYFSSLQASKVPHFQRSAFCHKFNCQTESGKQLAEIGKHSFAPFTSVEDAIEHGELRQHQKERTREEQDEHFI
jgi:hypothetical protein